MIAVVGASHSVHWDIESRSELRLDKVGAHKYASHPSTEIAAPTLPYQKSGSVKEAFLLPAISLPAIYLPASSIT